MGRLLFGDHAARRVSTRIASSTATLADLKAFSPEQRVNGMLAVVAADNSMWRWSDAATAAGDDMLIAAPGTGTGRWLRADGTADLALALSAATADAATVYTVPAGARVLVRRGYWEVTQAFTGGTSSAIGLSSSNAAYNTKGDLLGGAAGDLAATLTTGFKPGTIGAKTQGGVLLVAGDTIRFDRIASAFTVGAGFAHFAVDILANPGL